MATLIRGITSDGSARIMAIEGKDIVSRASEIHSTTPTATAALGRTLLGSSMMASLMSEPNAKFTMCFKGDGPLGTILCSADYFGNVKGYIQNPSVDLPLRADNKLNVGGGVGRGIMQVIRDTGGKEPYIGLSNIVTGEIAEDIASYYVNSEQIPTLCALGVLVDVDYSIKAAGGIIVQLLPFADESLTEKLEKNAMKAKTVVDLLCDGGIEALIGEFLDGIDYDVFDCTEVGYVCDCSRERCEKVLLSLGEEDYEEILKEAETEINCQFCEKKYIFTSDELRKIRENAKKI